MALTIAKIMQTAPVIPVITIDHPDDAVPLAEALVSGGLPVLEITLRTPHALAAITAIRTALPKAIVGAGTVINQDSFAHAEAAGAAFIVSPGVTPQMLACICGSQIPFLAGVSTPSEIMLMLEHDITAMKFFPAEAAGGVAMLKAFSGPLPQAVFCPTGGITITNASAYLALPNVACVGGSWMLPPHLVREKRWDDIRVLASAAAELGKGGTI